MYSAVIASIVVRPHGNADRLQLGVCVGHQVIVGPETKTGDVGIFFPPDGQLSVEYAKANKLMKEDGGYLDEKRRVRALRLRGEKSEGLWMPLTSLAMGRDTYGPWVVPVGTLLTEYNDKPICNRYETPQTRKQGLANKQQKKHPEFSHYKGSLSQLDFFSSKKVTTGWNSANRVISELVFAMTLRSGINSNGLKEMRGL